MAERDKGNSKQLAARTRKKRARNLRLIRIFTVVICICLSFFLGFSVRSNSSFLQTLGFPSSVTGLEDKKTDAIVNKDVYNSVSARVSEVEDIISEDSLESYDLNTATNAVMTALCDSAPNSSLHYYDAARYAQLVSANTDDYSGIGVMFSEYDGQAYAVDVFEGAAAQLSGVSVGDFVVAIDGDRSHKWSRSEVIAHLNASAGNFVTITWRRPTSLESDGGEEYTTSLKCSTYTEKNIATSLTDDVGYIQVKQITENSSVLVKQAITDLESQGAQAYVLDLRNNPGGYMNQAVNIASLFKNSGNVVQIETVNGTSVKAVSGSTVTNKPLVVLANGNTAASAEVLTAALKESGRASVVGETTLGKGSVQVTRELSFGGALRYTAAYYLTAQGHTINGVGILPTIPVSNGDSGDAQLDYAVELAASSITTAG